MEISNEQQTPPTTPTSTSTTNTPISDLRSRGSICLVCSKQYSKYCCPRCNTPYCSVVCYKAHDKNCTQKFTSEVLNSHLKVKSASNEEKKKMMEILSKMREMDVDDNEGEQEFFDNNLDDEEFKSLLSNAEKIKDISDLSEKQLIDFKRAISDGRLSQFIQPWKAWWEKDFFVQQTQIKFKSNGTANKNGNENGIGRKTLIQELTNDGDDDENNENGVDVVEEREKQKRLWKIEVPKLSSLLPSNKPSEMMKFHVLELIYGYSYLMRLFNGDPQSDIFDFSNLLIHLVPTLSSGGRTTFSSVSELLQGSIERSMKPPIDLDRLLSISSLNDSFLIFDSEKNIDRCLRETYCLLNDDFKSFENVEKQHTSTIHSELSKKIDLAKRKLIFFLSWLQWLEENGNLELLSKTSFEIKSFHSEQNQFLQQSTTKPTKIEKGLIIK